MINNNVDFKLMKAPFLLKYLIITAILLVAQLIVEAQTDRIWQALDDGNPKRALKLAKQGIEDGSLKKDPDAYFLQAQAYYTLMHDEFFLKKNPESLKISMKLLKKGKAKSEGSIPGEFDLLVDSFIMLNNDLGAYNYKINKYSKAVKIYKQSFELNGNRKAQFWIGKCLINNTDTTEGEIYFQNSIHNAIEQHAEEEEVDADIVEAFLYFGEKHWNNSVFDSANYYLEAGKKIYDNNNRIDYYLKEVAKAQIKALPPSNFMMEIIKRTLDYFPKDEFFIRKENALYVYQIRTYLLTGDTLSTDKLIEGILESKQAKSNSVDAQFYKKKDQFLAEKPENVIWKMAGYYNEHGYEKASNYLAHKYITRTADSKSFEDIQKRYTVIVSYAAKTKSLSMANQLLKYAELKYGENQELSSLRTSLIAKYTSKELPVADIGALYNLNIDNKKSYDEEFETLAIKYVDALIKDKQYVLAKAIITNNISNQLEEKNIWPSKFQYLAKEDFFHNYYMTRIQEETVAGMKVNGFEWNGDLGYCKEGELSEEIQQKIENRINYFRRQAGIPSILLDNELNGWCQKAALMMQANKKLDHEPKKSWRCFSDEGATAAAKSLLAQGVHTSKSITSFFADNKNPTLGNRKWLLYPNAKFYGYGSTNEYSVLWVLDDSGIVDSSLYENEFVSWPPEGYIPKMMIFKYWSFSMIQDLQGATISMSINGQSIPLEIQPYTETKGTNKLNTISWLPNKSLNTVKEDTVVDVTVTLKNGRRYAYAVNVMNFNAIGY